MSKLISNSVVFDYFEHQYQQRPIAIRYPKSVHGMINVQFNCAIGCNNMLCGSAISVNEFIANLDLDYIKKCIMNR